MFNTKYKAIPIEDRYTIFKRKWYSFFWHPTNIYCSSHDDAMSIIGIIKYVY